MITTFLVSSRAGRNPPPAATLHAALGRAPSVEEVAAALFESVRALEDRHASPLEESVVAELTRQHLEQYQNELWTWRR
jgi:lipoate-protein ligase A